MHRDNPFKAVAARMAGAPDTRFVVRDRGGSKWPFGLSASGTPRQIDHTTTRSNARVAMMESVQARSIVERMAETISDGGLRLEMTPRVEVLGISQDQASTWARNVEARFDLWAADKKQHRSENMTFYQSMFLYQLFQQRDNDIFTRFFYDNISMLQNPLQFDFIDPDQIRGDAYTVTSSQYSHIDGIERDERGRELSYKVWLRQSNGSYQYATIPAKTKDGRMLMLHGFRPEYAGQGRGFSRLAHAIQEFENITDFSASTIKKAINQSQIVAFVEPSKDEDASNPMEEIMTNRGAGPAAQMFGSAPTTAPPTEDPVSNVTGTYRVPEATFDTPGSMFVTSLTKGSTIKFPSATAPADSYDKFVDAFASHIAASLGIPLEVVLMKFSNNYSASRATLLLFWKTCVIWRSEMATDYLDPTVEMWLSGEIGAGRISAPGWSDPRIRAAWLCKNWIGSGAPDIDPAKTAKARRDNIEMCLTNLDVESRNHNGSRASDNIATNTRLFKNFPAAPWNESGNPPPGTPAPTAPAKAMLDEILNKLDEVTG